MSDSEKTLSAGAIIIFGIAAIIILFAVGSIHSRVRSIESMMIEKEKACTEEIGEIKRRVKKMGLKTRQELFHVRQMIHRRDGIFVQ